MADEFLRIRIAAHGSRNTDELTVAEALERLLTALEATTVLGDVGEVDGHGVAIDRDLDADGDARAGVDARRAWTWRRAERAA